MTLGLTPMYRLRSGIFWIIDNIKWHETGVSCFIPFNITSYPSRKHQCLLIGEIKKAVRAAEQLFSCI